MEQKSVEKMSSTPVQKLLLTMGIPVIISMMLQALYNIVDSAFVSNMNGGEDALNALTLAFPVQMLMVAIGVGTGVGVNVVLARSLGEKNRKQASGVAGNAIFLAIVITVLFMLFGLFGVRAYIQTQTTNELIYTMGVQYLQICCVGSMGIVFFNIFEKLLQATGLTVHSTSAQITGALVNIVLDPILIYGWLGLPAMGVCGAACATVIGQFASFFLALFFHIRFNHSLDKGLSWLKPEWHLIQEIYMIGLPAIIAQALMSFMTYGINIILVQAGESLVTAYGLFYKIQQFILFAAFGLRDTITPIVSYAYGMHSRKRIEDGIKYGVIYTLVIMLAGTLILEFCAEPLCQVFSLSGVTEQLCISAMRVISISFVFAGVSIALQGVFQALNCGGSSLVISFFRQLLFILPVAWVFVQFIEDDLSNAWIVWLTFPIAELVTTATAIWLMVRSYHRKVKNLTLEK